MIVIDVRQERRKIEAISSLDDVKSYLLEHLREKANDRLSKICVPAKILFDEA